MANNYCEECENVKVASADFSQNGVTDTVCASLKNNTGLSPKNRNDNCKDLSDVVDCLIGSLDDDLENYDSCTWKDFMRKLIPNLYNTLKADVCNECGQWSTLNLHTSQIANHESRLDTAECKQDFLLEGYKFTIGEDESDGSYVVAGKGVSFLNSSGGSDYTSDVYLRYISGGLIRGGGSYRFYDDSFTDGASCYNYDDNGTNPTKSKSRKGNKVWGDNGRPAKGGELIAEIRIKKSEYPQIKSLWSGFGQESGNGAYHVSASVFNEGEWAYGQHGRCSSNDGTPTDDGYSHGHKVPEGWIYVQIRMNYIWSLRPSGTQYSPWYFMGIRFNQDALGC